VYDIILYTVALYSPRPTTDIPTVSFTCAIFVLYNNYPSHYNITLLIIRTSGIDLQTTVEGVLTFTLNLSKKYFHNFIYIRNKNTMGRIVRRWKGGHIYCTLQNKLGLHTPLWISTDRFHLNHLNDRAIIHNVIRVWIIIRALQQF